MKTFMKTLCSLVLTWSLLFLALPIYEVSAKGKKSMPDKIGINTVEKILRFQEKAFESNRPLWKNKLTKLHEKEETVVAFEGNQEILGVKLKDFSYEIDHVEVYKNANNEIIIEASVKRYFNWGEFTSGYRDDWELVVNNRTKKKFDPLTTDNDLEENVSLRSNTADLPVKSKDIVGKVKKELKMQQAKLESSSTYKNGNVSTQNHEGEGYRTEIGPYTWSPYQAVEYAKKWALDRNPKYNDFPGTDCTNFVSQALHEGGIGMYYDATYPKWGSWYSEVKNHPIEEWKYSLPWVNAWAFNDMLDHTNIIFSTRPHYPTELGDIFFYDKRGEWFWDGPDGKPEHAAIVTDFVFPYTLRIPLVSYHTTDRLNVPWYYYWMAYEGSTYWVTHINR